MTLSRFWARLPFDPDPFQVEAARALEAGKTVVVTAPTGSGKTVVGEAGVHLALASRKRAFYTTPLKALSNQKYRDFCASYSSESVGLLTGDNVINGDAPIVVMTTEVLRNMIYASAQLDEVAFVILDEVHYLQDPSRGAVWEEVIIHAPPHVQLVALSATVSNAEIFARWIESRRGPTALITEAKRPVPLESLYLIADRYDPERLVLHQLFGRDGRSANPDVTRLLAHRGRRGRFSTPRRSEIATFLSQRDMLPAIYFIFSRSGCEAAAARLVAEGVSFTAPPERDRIRRVAEERTEALTDSELAALGYASFLEGLVRGVAPHHAGMVSPFRETVEHLFQEGLARLVFATETLSLGINMPAKTVVLESMTKFTGESREPLLPGDYTQLTGRAGRRGIDTRGFGVSLYSPYMTYDRIVGTAAAGSHPVESSFRPTYNMAVNLIANYEEARAERLLNASFAHFARAADGAKLERSIDRTRAKLSQAEDVARCERGDVTEYAAAVRKSGSKGPRQAFVRRLGQGSVLDVPSGKTAGRVVVLQRWGGTDTRVLVVGERADLTRMRLRDLPPATEHLGTMELPAPYRPRSPGYRMQLSESLARFRATEHLRMSGAPSVVSHPVHACPDRSKHLIAADRARSLARELARLERALSESEGGLLAEFQAIRSVLDAWGYTEGWRLTSKGTILRSIYSERDLIVTEAIQRRLTDGLEPPELAALFSAVVYEPRREALTGTWPTAAVARAGRRMVAIAAELAELERAFGLTVTRAPDPGIAELVHAWALGAHLEELLAPDDVAAGDFVRTARQLIDVLRQVRDVSRQLQGPMSRTIELIDRNVVAASGRP